MVLVLAIKKLKKTGKTERTEKPYLAGRYSLWKTIVFAVLFSFFRFFQCFFLISLGRYILWKNIVFSVVSVFFVFF